MSLNVLKIKVLCNTVCDLKLLCFISIVKIIMLKCIFCYSSVVCKDNYKQICKLISFDFSQPDQAC